MWCKRGGRLLEDRESGNRVWIWWNYIIFVDKFIGWN